MGLFTKTSGKGWHFDKKTGTLTIDGYMGYTANAIDPFKSIKDIVRSVVALPGAKPVLSSGLFSNMNKLVSADLKHLDISDSEYISMMFSRCTSLTSLDLSAWDVGDVKTFKGMFYNCGSLQTLDLTGWRIGQDADTTDMFMGIPGTACIITDDPTLLALLPEDQRPAEQKPVVLKSVEDSKKEEAKREEASQKSAVPKTVEIPKKAEPENVEVPEVKEASNDRELKITNDQLIKEIEDSRKTQIKNYVHKDESGDGRHINKEKIRPVGENATDDSKLIGIIGVFNENEKDDRLLSSRVRETAARMHLNWRIVDISPDDVMKKKAPEADFFLTLPSVRYMMNNVTILYPLALGNLLPAYLYSKDPVEIVRFIARHFGITFADKLIKEIEDGKYSSKENLQPEDDSISEKSKLIGFVGSYFDKLVSDKVRENAAKKHLDWKIVDIPPEDVVKKTAPDADVFLICPGYRYMMNTARDNYPTAVINLLSQQLYATNDAEKIVSKIAELCEKDDCKLITEKKIIDGEPKRWENQEQHAEIRITDEVRPKIDKSRNEKEGKKVLVNIFSPMYQEEIKKLLEANEKPKYVYVRDIKRMTMQFEVTNTGGVPDAASYAKKLITSQPWGRTIYLISMIDGQAFMGGKNVDTPQG